DAEPAALLGHGIDRLCTAGMTLDPLLALRASPTAVAVHDDGDVPRQLRGVERFGFNGKGTHEIRRRLTTKDTKNTKEDSNRTMSCTNLLYFKSSYFFVFFVSFVVNPQFTREWFALDPGRRRRPTPAGRRVRRRGRCSAEPRRVG